MIEHRTGDLFKSDITALAHGCNTVGAMGAGIAVEFKRRFPQMYLAYRDLCRTGQFKGGEVLVWDDDAPYTIFNLATQAHWQLPAKPEYIEQAVIKMLIEAGRRGISQIAMPRIGAGLGSLRWYEVEEILERCAPDESPVLVVYSL
jgi:O-acetyl-ADP-ribose deacetylase (regulator of RNase III)